MQFKFRDKPYWLNEPVITGSEKAPTDGGILIIGSGLSGTSCAYWLKKFGFPQITIVDYQTTSAASFRNCGHILYGTVESFEALSELHGVKQAEKIFDFSVDACHEVRETIKTLDNSAESCEYEQSGYHVISIDENEQKEIERSAIMLNKLGIKNDILTKEDVQSLGFKNCYGGRYEYGDAKAHPVKFRNLIMRDNLKRDIAYHSNYKVTGIDASLDQVKIAFQKDDKTITRTYDAIVIAANAYSPLFSDYFKKKRLVEPFKGQIITSAPLKQEFKVKGSHSFNHGYEYALITQDNRLMIGGWRNNTPTGEIGTYDLKVNPDVEQGLINFVDRHYSITEQINWDYSWSGIMATSHTGLPLIGPTSDPLVFCCSGFTGHGFSWAHGSAKLCAQIMSGHNTNQVEFNFKP